MLYDCVSKLITYDTYTQLFFEIQNTQFIVLHRLWHCGYLIEYEIVQSQLSDTFYRSSQRMFHLNPNLNHTSIMGTTRAWTVPWWCENHYLFNEICVSARFRVQKRLQFRINWIDFAYGIMISYRNVLTRWRQSVCLWVSARCARTRSKLPLQLATTNAGRRARAKSKVLLGRRFTVHMVTILTQIHTLPSPSSKGHQCDRVPSIFVWFVHSTRVGCVI